LELGVLQNLLSSDCAAWPQKGRHGYDNGDWIRLHRHQWIPTDGQVVDAWKKLFEGIGYAIHHIPITVSAIYTHLRLCLCFRHWNLECFKIYILQARWDDCIAACDELAKGGFALDKKWNDTFRADNDKE